MSGLGNRQFKSAGRTAFRFGSANKTAIDGNMTGDNPVAAAAYKTAFAQMKNDDSVQNDMENGRKPEKSKTSGSDWLLAGALEGLNASKKYQGNVRKYFVKSKKDSNEYQNVKNGLSAVLNVLDTSFKADAQGNKNLMKEIVMKYAQLKDACEIYIKKKGGGSSSGQIRKNQVSQILELINTDITHLQYLAFDAKNSELADLENKSWAEVLDYARAGKIEEEDLSSRESFGGGAKTDDRRGRVLDSGRFTVEDIFEADDKDNLNGFGLNSFSSLMDESIVINGKEKRQYGTEDTRTNMTNRNVAMSRIANILGIGGVIAQSKSVRIHDQKTGKTIRGNLMEEAKGISGNKEKKKVYNSVKNIADFNEREGAVKRIVAPSVQKELSSLQVLDYICGQGDRHDGNFFMQRQGTNENDSVISHITGIDNDNSFSTGVDLEAETRKRKMAASKLKMVVDSNDDLIIAHIDEQLAENIRNLTEDEIKLAISDLIEPKYIQLTLERFRKVKRAVEKEFDKGEDSKIVRNNQWNEKTHDDFMKNTRLYREIVMPLRNAEVKGDDSQYFKSIKSVFNTDEAYDAVKHDSYYSILIMNMVGAHVGDGSDEMLKISKA